MTDRLAEIKARAQAIIPGPWRWYGNTATDQIHLATVDRGRLYILAPNTRSEDYVFNHDQDESYTIPEARARVLQWCPVHGDDEFPGDATDRAVHCRCDELREFLAADHLEPEEGYRELTRGVHAWLTRGVVVHADLRFPDTSLDDRRNRGGTMRSYREDVRYEVLDHRTRAEFEADPQEAPVDQALYREDFCGLDQPEAEFIAHAAEDIPWLIARVEELEQMVESEHGTGKAQ
jgi:hypothetical protein